MFPLPYFLWNLWDTTADHGASENSLRVVALRNTRHSWRRLYCNSWRCDSTSSWGPSAFALQRTLLQFGPHLGMGVFFQFLQYYVSGVFEQIHKQLSWGHLYLKLPNSVWGLRRWMKWWGWNRQEHIVHFSIHHVQVMLFPFTHFCGRIRLPRTFIHTFFLVVL